MSFSSKAFDKLRLDPATRSSAAAALLGAAGGLAGVASAAVVNLKQTVTAGGVNYSSIQNLGSVRTQGGVKTQAYAISDATIIGGKTDAFDGAVSLAVNGTAFAQPNNQVDLSTTAAGTFLNTVTPQDIGGIATSLDYFFSASEQTVRAFARFTNTTGSPLPVSAVFGGNLGSDNTTTVFGTSSGDNALQANQDLWLINNQADQADPFTTWVLGGVGGTAATWGDWQKIFGVEWSLTLAPGETKDLLWFVNLNDALAGAQADIATFASFNTLDAAGLLAGLSPSDLANTANWDLTPPASGSVPEAPTGLIMLAGAWALASQRRRRS
jgi:hypothetical protein